MEEVKEYLVSGTTKSGIAYTVDTRVRNDTRFLQSALRMRNKKLSNEDRANALFSLLGLLFGSDDGVALFENEVAAHHDGICSVETLVAELNDIYEATNLKN